MGINSSKQLIGGQCSGTLLMAKLGLLNGVAACTDLTTRPWVEETGVAVLNAPFTAIAKGNIATAGGCLASQYLAGWVIGKLAGIEQLEQAIHYVAPVGEKEQTVRHCTEVISPFL